MNKHYVMWYWRNGKPVFKEDCSNKEWLAAIEKVNKKLRDPKYKRVGANRLWWGGWVSTVWLGLDCGFFSKKPLIFETMVFPEFSNRLDDWGDRDCERYSTEEEAREGHWRMYWEWTFSPKVFPIIIEKIKRRLT